MASPSSPSPAVAIAATVALMLGCPQVKCFSTKEELDVLLKILEPFQDHILNVVGNHHPNNERFERYFLALAHFIKVFFRISNTNFQKRLHSPLGSDFFPKVNCSAASPWPRHQVDEIFFLQKRVTFIGETTICSCSSNLPLTRSLVFSLFSAWMPTRPLLC